MKVLLSSDLHGNHEAIRWLVRSAQEKSAPLILAGDLLGYPEGFTTVEEAQEADAARMFETLAQSGVPVFYIWGNDDFVEPPSPALDVRFIHERRIELGPWNLVGYQHSLPFVGGPHERDEATIAEDLSKLEPWIDSKTVLVTHSPAYGILDIGVLDVHAGSPAILDLVMKFGVRAHVHGHIHRSFGVEGVHFNVAASARCQAVLLDLDTLQSEVLRGDEATG